MKQTINKEKKSKRETLELFNYLRKRLKNYPDIGILGTKDINWFTGKINLVDMRHTKLFVRSDRRFAKSFEIDVVFPISYKEDYKFYLGNESMKLYQIARKIISWRE